MAKTERVYNVPLRKEYQKVAKYKRSKKAVTALRQFAEKHMKSDDVKIGKYVNEKIWERGIKNPPHHVKVNVVKDDDNKVTVELVGAPVKEEKVEGKEEKKVEEKEEGKEEDKKEIKEEKEETKEEKEIKKEDKKVEEKKEELKEGKKEEKEEIKKETKEKIKEVKKEKKDERKLK